MRPDWTPQYKRRKAAIQSDDVRRSLELAEEAVLVDPHHRHNRRDLDDVTWDTNEPGIALAYHLDRDVLVYVTFIDLWNRGG